MFEPNDTPRVFGVAPGIDFPQALWEGLAHRMKSQPPDAMARVQIIVNTQRMARRLRAIIDDHGPMLLPRIDLLSSVGLDLAHKEIPAAVPPLRRRFELIQLIAGLLEAQPDLASRASLYDLADSLAGLMDEMSGEGVSPDTIAALDVSDQSGHWERAQAFFAIARDFVASADQAPDSEARQRMIVNALIQLWQSEPPEHPVILAGSTGSRGTTQLLMQAVAALPQGALVLPGFDFDTPDAVWGAMSDALTGEDHPQFRFQKIMENLGVASKDVSPWGNSIAPCPPRNALISLALRPAPVTDQWRTEGPDLKNLDAATAQVTLLEAPSVRQEAIAIAMRLRQAAEDGQTAALITPDRMLTRQVTAALDRWDILPDDSAGTPLQLSPPGRFLRQIAAYFSRPLTAESLLALLKHPLCHSGTDRNHHLRFTRDLELHIRKTGLTFPDANSLAAWSSTIDGATEWGAWVVTLCCDAIQNKERPLSDWLQHHLDIAEALARGSSDKEGSGGLWDEKAGREAARIVEELRVNADYAGPLSAIDYGDVFGAILARGEVRDRDAPHPHILIWGTLEARVQGADLTILGGLNEGSWPENAAPDPWLNRKMRLDAGLLLPERRIGLSAHDFQQAVGGKEVWITRSIRSDDAETVPSRWLNRIVNLLAGLERNGGPDALASMRQRGQDWLNRAESLERVRPQKPAIRPSPRPPISARPSKLSVTEIKRLIRDPYAIYARHVLRLRPMMPLMRAPDALLRGIVIHEILERFVKEATKDPNALTVERLTDISESILAQNVPWPQARALWAARIDRIAGHFVADEQKRQMSAQPVGFESHAATDIAHLGFTLTGTADRIDRMDSGDLKIYDYKTGSPPSQDEQRYFDKQLLLEAAMAEKGGFRDIAPADVAEAIYIGLSNSPKNVAAPLAKIPAAQVWAEFEQLVARYLDPGQGFTARRALRKDTDHSDYDQLARFGEWDVTNEPSPEDLT